MLEFADPTGIDNQAIDQIVTTTLPNCSLDPRYRSASAILSNGGFWDICGGRAPASSTMYLLMGRQLGVVFRNPSRGRSPKIKKLT